MRQRAIRCTAMRGGTSKGLYFRGADLPADPAVRDAVLLAAMGSPDPRQIDGMGGAHPLSSKIAVVAPSARADADVEYRFLQVWPDRPTVSDDQNCGNMLAGVGPFALTEGMVAAAGPVTPVRIWMANTASLAVAHVPTPCGEVDYDGDASIDGVPGTAAGIPIDFLDVAGSTCGALLPTGSAADTVDGVAITCIDNGMPVVCLRAADLGVTGSEPPAGLEADRALCAAVESIRLQAGTLMGLGDVTNRTVPKVSLLAPPAAGGAVLTRTFIPKRVHEAIGVFGAVSVATACLVPGSVAAAAAEVADGPVDGPVDVVVEHPTGAFTISMDVDATGATPVVRRAALLRTARLLMRGDVMVPGAVWAEG